MILIDASYLNSFGGKTIINLFLKELFNSSLKYHLLLDARLDLNVLKQIDKSYYSIITVSHRNRLFFYKNNIKNFSSIVCLSSIPPPLKNNLSTTIFFHNQLFLDCFKYNIKFTHKLVNYLKFLYIKFYNNKNYQWITQTQLIKSLVHDNLKVDLKNISVYPIFKSKSKSKTENKNFKNFVYVSSPVFHKNHNRLINAFILAANKTEITLNLTLKKEELSKRKYPSNLKVKFHGTLSRDSVNELYNSCRFAIYPSLVESFGLPLIEAANHGCKVIASDLPYVHEIIKPSLTFDPYSIESMADAILNAIETDNLPETKVLVDNKLDNFMKFIISQDVQK